MHIGIYALTEFSDSESQKGIKFDRVLIAKMGTFFGGMESLTFD